MDLRKLGVRTLASLGFGPFILLCAWKGGYLFFAMVTSLVILGTNEFYNLAVQKVTFPQRVTGIATGVALCFLFFQNQAEHAWMVLAAASVVIMLFELFRNQVAPILNVATTLMGTVYVGLLLAFLILIREISPRNYALGGDLVILIFACIWVCDSAAYMLGSQFGRHKLFERVSPNKTVEGTLFGFAFALITAYICHITFIGEVALVHVLGIGAICGALGQMSDLLESLFKRDAQVKDSSNLIPGHGGILDRFDSEILVAPATYFYLHYVVF